MWHPPKDESSPEGRMTLWAGQKIFRPAYRKRDRSAAEFEPETHPHSFGGTTYASPLHRKVGFRGGSYPPRWS